MKKAFSRYFDWEELVIPLLLIDIWGMPGANRSEKNITKIYHHKDFPETPLNSEFLIDFLSLTL